jgi:hypothetical protein
VYTGMLYNSTCSLGTSFANSTGREGGGIQNGSASLQAVRQYIYSLRGAYK